LTGAADAVQLSLGGGLFAAQPGHLFVQLAVIVLKRGDLGQRPAQCVQLALKPVVTIQNGRDHHDEGDDVEAELNQRGVQQMVENRINDVHRHVP
jgi:hypothetical protein